MSSQRGIKGIIGGGTGMHEHESLSAGGMGAARSWALESVQV